MADPVADMLAPAPATPVVPDPPLTTEETTELDALYKTLDLEARMAYAKFFMAHTPERGQEHMKAKVLASLPAAAA